MKHDNDETLLEELLRDDEKEVVPKAHNDSADDGEKPL